MTDLLLFLLGVAATVAVGFWFRPKAQLPKMLSVVSHQTPLIRVEDDVSEKIRITFDGEEIDGVTRVQAYLWNSGGEKIAGDDVSAADPLRVAVECGRLISNPIVEQSRNSVDAKALQQPDGLHIVFDLLDLNDWIKIEFLLNKVAETKDKPQIEGVIAGIPEGIQNLHMRDMYLSRHMDFFYSSKRRSYIVEVYIFSALFVVFLATSFFPDFLPEIVVVYRVTAAVFCLAIVALNVWALRRTYTRKSPIQKFRSPPWIDEETSGIGK